jgi:hypothetical protein
VVHEVGTADNRQEVSAAMKVAELGVQARGRARRGSPRSRATGFKMSRANVCLKPLRCGRAVAMRTSVPIVISQNNLSVLMASESEILDNSRGLQYGLELVIPMSSRRLEKR